MEYYALTNYLAVTKIFRFEMGHVLYNHEGLCRNIHGHSYKLHVSITGDIKQETGASDDGMVMDFGDLKKIVREQLLNRFDHALVVNAGAPYADELLKMDFERTLALPFQPSCENLIVYFAKILVPALPPGVKLLRLRLFETEDSYAEWFA